MSLIEKVTGRAKQVIGDLTGDRSLSRQGRKEEAKGEKKEELDRAEARVEQKAQEVGELERETWRHAGAQGRSAGRDPLG
jgi:uncharacterized protein YjbJ (UPF0337 family)